MSLPLSGLRIVDLSSVAFGPYASQILADQGAEVIKVESPEGDSSRYTGPARHPGMAAMFLALNRNKKSVVIDLKLAAGREALWQLVDDADVVMHNIRAQKTQAIGIDYDTLSARNPRLVYAHLSGFGEAGPYAGRPAYDDIIQGMCGAASLMQRQFGEPRYLPTILADKTCGIVAAQAITAALLSRQSSGSGMRVEVPMYETMVSFMLLEHWYGNYFDEHAGPLGYPRVLDESRRPYATGDGHICLMPYGDRHWRDFWQAAGRADLGADARFSTMQQRTAHIAELYALLGEVLRTRSTDAWLALCEELQIPACRVNSLEEIQQDPHLRAVGFFQEVQHPSEGRLQSMTSPVLFDGQRAPLAPAPRLGEHNHEILGCAASHGSAA